MLGGWWCDAHALCARRRAQTCPPPPHTQKEWSRTRSRAAARRYGSLKLGVEGGSPADAGAGGDCGEQGGRPRVTRGTPRADRPPPPLRPPRRPPAPRTCTQTAPELHSSPSWGEGGHVADAGGEAMGLARARAGGGGTAGLGWGGVRLGAFVWLFVWREAGVWLVSEARGCQERGEGHARATCASPPRPSPLTNAPVGNRGPEDEVLADSGGCPSQVRVGGGALVSTCLVANLATPSARQQKQAGGRVRNEEGDAAAGPVTAGGGAGRGATSMVKHPTPPPSVGGGQQNCSL